MKPPLIEPPPLRQVDFFPPLPPGALIFFFPQKPIAYRVANLFLGNIYSGSATVMLLSVGVVQSGNEGYATSEIFALSGMQSNTYGNWNLSPQITSSNNSDATGLFHLQDSIPADLVVNVNEQLFVKMTIDSGVSAGDMQFAGGFVLTSAPP